MPTHTTTAPITADLDTYLFVLGAPDPEMKRIAEILELVGARVAYATHDGKRVSPRTAYKADGVIGQSLGNCCVSWESSGTGACPACGTPYHEDTHHAASVVWVECGGDLSGAPCCCGRPASNPAPTGECGACEGREAGPELTVADHHRPGDPGYGRGPEEFLPASSLGQVVSLLAKEGKLSSWRPLRGAPRAMTISPPGDLRRNPAHSAHFGGQWTVVLSQREGERLREVVLVPHELVLTAAGDHCLAAAYAGQCPGVSPRDLLQSRALGRGAWLAKGDGGGRDIPRREVAALADPFLAEKRVGVEAVLDELDNRDNPPRAWACAVLAATAHTRLKLRSGDLPTVNLGGVEVIDVRGLGTLAEIPTAASLEGVAALYRMLLPSGRVKVGILGGGAGSIPGEAPIRAFLEGWAEGEGLTDLYGDPTRGCAGGYEE